MSTYLKPETIARSTAFPAQERRIASILRRYGSLIARALGIVLVLIAFSAIYGLCLLHALAEKLPAVDNIASLTSRSETRILSEDGALLAHFQSQFRHPVRLAEISPFLIDATIATEDSRFYEHSGLDYRGIGRALLSNMIHGDAVGQGGSTLTQQLARTLYLSPDKTLRRKMEEALLARKIEERYTKSQILEAYLNTVYYGNGAYGAEAASRRFFGKPAKQLTLGEAALLAGLPQRPVALSPIQHLDAALRRRERVLSRMVTAGKITQGQAAQAIAEPLAIQAQRLPTSADWKAPYFVVDVLRHVRDTYGAEFLYSGVTIVTTLDWRMQQAAERAFQAGMRRGIANTGALICIDPHDGAVRALVGGPHFAADQFDAATQGVRQPGSTFKPIVYVTAFDASLCTLETRFQDAPLTYAGSPHSWTVHDYSGRYHGQVSVLDSLRLSLNSVAVQVAQQAGPQNIVTTAQEMGITTPLTPVLPLALGASGVHPIDLCSAYSLFANHGERYDPTFLRKITDRKGQTLFQDDPASRKHPAFLSQTTLDQINIALRAVVTGGTGQAANCIPDAHGKTGTTTSLRDAWFVGYTSNLVTAIWMAHASKEIRMSPQGLRQARTLYLPMESASGGKLCGPVWSAFMAAAAPIQRKVNRAFGIPDFPIETPRWETLLATLRNEGYPESEPTPSTDVNSDSLNQDPEEASIASLSNIATDTPQDLADYRAMRPETPSSSPAPSSSTP